jgi:UDP-N-acetylmuramoylalanine--D-glutamate ligase
MMHATAFKDKRIAVYGLARSGLSVARALVRSGAEVIAWDASEAARMAATQTGIVLQDFNGLDWAQVDGLLLSPGVPLYFPEPHSVVKAARANGVPIFGDIEVFAAARRDLPPHRVVAITGTNGKSTCTALIHHVLVECGLPAVLGGNIGAPILDQTPLPNGGVYVLEISSFQIDLTQNLAADVAVLTNITPDHLDRHGTFENYAQAKERLFEMQAPDGVAVIGVDDVPSVKIAGRRSGTVIPISAVMEVSPGVSCIAGPLRENGAVVGDQSHWPALQGPHNAQNAAAAFAACRALGLAAEHIVAAFRTYPGLPHRMERVRELNGVLYVNDSKATNPTSTAPALAAYPKVHWILGGKAKTEDLEACAPAFGHVRAAYTIGDAQDLFTRLLAGQMTVFPSSTMEKAVALAHAHARPGEVVLLSPACASYDQYKDFEARGSHFRTLVEALQ